MIDYLEHKVSKTELNNIFKKGIDRSIFIGAYPYFGADGNEPARLSVSLGRFNEMPNKKRSLATRQAFYLGKNKRYY